MHKCKVHGGKRKGFMVANISCFKLSTSMAKQRLSFDSINKVTRCARALTRRLTMSAVLESVFEPDTSSDDGSEISEDRLPSRTLMTRCSVHHQLARLTQSRVRPYAKPCSAG